MREMEMKRMQWKILMTAFALVIAVGPASVVFGQDVLVWATGNVTGDTQGVADYVMASGYFNSVTASDNAFETLETLTGYDAVLYFTNGEDGDMVAIGNVLADYADTGRRLVIATFSWADQGGNTLAGRIIDEEISPFVFDGSSLYTNVTMDSNDGHAIFDNVDEISGYYHDDVTLTTGAEQHATWSDGEPLAADKGNVVAINLFPDDSWGNLSGDFEALFANTLRPSVVATEIASWAQVKAAYRTR